jgi:hypothetical protein
MYFTALPAPKRYGVALKYGMSRWQCGAPAAAAPIAADRGCVAK